ncbi:unnamed protein product, partial [Mesorhabditis belari]|uniref:RRM domain-containing protein n=1 Tax=Mesorhabditis belari TaxID=2138241 RepID=A0AAF3EUH1_9BILA
MSETSTSLTCDCFRHSPFMETPSNQLRVSPGFAKRLLSLLTVALCPAAGFEAASALAMAALQPISTLSTPYSHASSLSQSLLHSYPAAAQLQAFYTATQQRPHAGIKRGPDLLSPNASVFNSVMTIDQEAKKAKLDPGSAAAAVFSHLMPQGLSAQFLTGTPLSQFEIAMAPVSSAMSISHFPGNLPSSTSNHRNVDSGPPPKPSRVVHLRNIPSDMVDVELVHFCMQYGKINNYMLLKGKNQAFVEFEEQMCSTTMCDSLAAVPIQIRGRTMFAQYSTHQELKVESTPRKRNENTNGGTNGDEIKDITR